MFKQILVPLDGSARAEQALPVAAHVARTCNGTITLIKAVNPPTEFMEEVGMIVLPDILDEDVAVAKEYLEGVAPSSSLEGVHTATKVVTGHPAQCIIAEANADNVDLILLSSHGHTHVTHWSMGSIAQKVARHAPSPVLVLHEGCAIASQAGISSVRILVALDGSKHAETSIVPAALLAQALSAPGHGELHLTRVVSQPSEEGGNFDQAVQRAEQYLGSVVDRLRQQALIDAAVPPGLPITWSVTVADDAASGIVQAAGKSRVGEYAERDQSCQVIAIATYGHGGLRPWALGSTSERVLQAMRQPVLIVTPLTAQSEV